MSNLLKELVEISKWPGDAIENMGAPNYAEISSTRLDTSQFQ